MTRILATQNQAIRLRFLGLETAPGNRTFAEDADGELTTHDLWTYTYDDDGNLTKKSKCTLTETWNYGYDNGNQVLWVVKSAADGGTVIQSFHYSHDANEYLAITQTVGNNVMVTRFGYEAFDELTDPDVLTSESTPRNRDRYAHAGCQTEVGTDLEYFWHRYLDPNTMPWTVQESLGFGGGDENLYRYVNNESTNSVDPSGLEEKNGPVLSVGNVGKDGGARLFGSVPPTPRAVAWPIQWSLSQGASEKGGVVLQHIRILQQFPEDPHKGKAENEPIVILDYWEGWRIEAGKTTVDLAKFLHTYYNDYYKDKPGGVKFTEKQIMDAIKEAGYSEKTADIFGVNPATISTHRSRRGVSRISILGTAYYFDGTQNLPKAFRVGGAKGITGRGLLPGNTVWDNQGVNKNTVESVTKYFKDNQELITSRIGHMLEYTFYDDGKSTTGGTKYGELLIRVYPGEAATDPPAGSDGPPLTRIPKFLPPDELWNYLPRDGFQPYDAWERQYLPPRPVIGGWPDSPMRGEGTIV